MYGIQETVAINEAAYVKHASRTPGEVRRDEDRKAHSMVSLAERKAKRDVLVEQLAGASVEELTAAVNTQGCPTILEEALLLKLQRIDEEIQDYDPTCPQ